MAFASSVPVMKPDERFTEDAIKRLHGNPLFEAIWSVVKTWEIDRGQGPAGGSGTDAAILYYAILEEGSPTKLEELLTRTAGWVSRLVVLGEKVDTNDPPSLLHTSLMDYRRQVDNLMQLVQIYVGARVRQREEPPPSRDELEAALLDMAQRIGRNIQPLDPEASRILYDNVWDLYQR